MAVMQLSEEQAELLSKKQPDDSMSLSERLLIESAAEKDRISEPKVRKNVDWKVLLHNTTHCTWN